MNFLADFFKKDPDKSFILNYAPIFTKLNFMDKSLILQKSKVVEYNKGDIIYKELSPADAFYCVISGRVRIFTGAKDTLEYLNCGKYFGMISLLTNEPHSASVEAVNDSKILKIEKDDFRMILNKIPRLAIDLSMTLSRRLRKKDSSGKSIFESNIVSVFSAVKDIGRTMYASNLAVSLRKETNREIIVVSVIDGNGEPYPVEGLSLLAKDKIIRLDTPLPVEETIKKAICKDEDLGLSILNVTHDTSNVSYVGSLKALITYLTSGYHYVIVDLPALMDEVIFQTLNQSDLIHIITDYDVENLKSTKALIVELFQKVNYPQEKIKVIINAKKESVHIPPNEVNNILDYELFATLPVFWDNDEKSEKPSYKVVLEHPKSEYSKAIRRISRELGDVRVGLVLGGGAAFGLAHIGVLKLIEKENIPIDVVCGTSMGALIGAFWATGVNPKQIENIFFEYDNNRKGVYNLLMDLCFPKLSLAEGKRIKIFLEKHLGNKTFQDTRLPFKITACNLNKRQEVIFDTGRIVDAIMASIAIPGVFTPTKMGDDLVVDGGIIAPVPVGVLVKMGIKKIIAVNVLPSPENVAQSYEIVNKKRDIEKAQAHKKGFLVETAFNFRMHSKRSFSPNILDVIVNSMQIMEYVISEADCQKADVVIRPIVPGVDWFEFFKVDILVKKGEEEAKNALSTIKSIISE